MTHIDSKAMKKAEGKAAFQDRPNMARVVSDLMNIDYSGNDTENESKHQK